jgi:hypothetical protein
MKLYFYGRTDVNRNLLLFLSHLCEISCSFFIKPGTLITKMAVKNCVLSSFFFFLWKTAEIMTLWELTLVANLTFSRVIVDKNDNKLFVRKWS